MLDSYGFNSSIYPCHLATNFLSFAKFPDFFGKFSSTKKMNREIKELASATMGTIFSSREGFKSDYAPKLLEMLKFYLEKGDKESLKKSFEIYENYGLTPDLVREHLVDIVYNPTKADLFNGVETKTKTAMTKMYNSKYKDSFKPIKKKTQNFDESKLSANKDVNEEEGDYSEDDEGEENVIYEVEQVNKAQTTKKRK